MIASRDSAAELVGQPCPRHVTAVIIETAEGLECQEGCKFPAQAPSTESGNTTTTSSKAKGEARAATASEDPAPEAELHDTVDQFSQPEPEQIANNNGHAYSNPRSQANTTSTGTGSTSKVSSANEWREWREKIKQAAHSRGLSLLREWYPRGKQERNQYRVGSVDGNEQGRSLVVWLDKFNFKDYGDDNIHGANLVSLYMHRFGKDYKAAYDELGELFTIPKPERSQVSKWRVITPIPEFAKLDDRGWPALGFTPAIKGEMTGAWLYHDSDGKRRYYRARWDCFDGTKEFRPITWCQDEHGNQAWQLKDVEAPRPLYRLDLLAKRPDRPVLILEGEKTADAAQQLLPDWVCTTFGSSKAIKNIDWSPLLLRKTRLVIWPDHDRDGKTAAVQAAAHLENRAEIVQPDPAWREHWDLANGLAEGWDTARVLAYLETHATKTEAPKFERTQINIAGGDLEAKTGAVWTALKVTNDPPNPPWIVRTTNGNEFAYIGRDFFGRAIRTLIEPDLLRCILCQRYDFKRFDNKGNLVSCSPSDELIHNLLAYPQAPVPFLTRITEVPILAPDGRLILTEGFDPKSGIYYLPSPDLKNLDLGPEPPSPSEIEGALALVEDLLVDFPFLEPCDKAHAIAFMLVPIMRLTIRGRTPMFRFEAPQARTGKSMLMRLEAGIIGCENIVDIPPTLEEEEWRKRITSAMRQEPQVLLIDNAESLESASLKNLLTSDFWMDRLMATNKMVRVPIQCAFGVSLNNPIISRELMGRSLRVRIDAKMQFPESRKNFKHPYVEEWARLNRAALVGALATLARVKPKAQANAPVLGGFEDFCRRMAGTLNAIGIKGFLADRKDLSALSDEENALMEFVQEWVKQYPTPPDHRVETRQLVSIAENIEGFPLGRTHTEHGKLTAVGTFLRSKRGHTVGEWRIGDPSTTRPTTWTLHAASNYNGSQKVSKVSDSGDDQSPDDLNTENNDSEQPF